MRVSTEARDKLAKIASDDLGGVSLDAALRELLFEHESAAALARLEADPEALADYQREARDWAELAVGDGLENEPPWTE
jgi:hypothetical protein